MLHPGGVLAAQIPYVKEMLLHQILTDLVQSPKWSRYFEELPTTYTIYPPDYYYDVLCKLTPHIQLWETRYFHIMSSYEDLLNWYKGTGLRPYLDCFSDGDRRAEFENDLLTEVMKYYPANADGKILFPFPRIFFIAQK